MKDEKKRTMTGPSLVVAAALEQLGSVKTSLTSSAFASLPLVRGVLVLSSSGS